MSVQIHWAALEHARHIKQRANAVRLIVSLGVTSTAVFTVIGLHDTALGVSIFTNLVWIWEG